jgi:hypothetical protein
LKNLKGKDHLEDLSVDRKIILDLRNIGWEGLVWMRMAQNREVWWGLGNTVMNLWVT